MLVLILAGLGPLLSAHAYLKQRRLCLQVRLQSSVAAAHPRSLDVASLRARMRSDTPMPSSDVG